MSRDAIFEASVDYFLAPIGPYLADESVTEIMVNGFDQIYIERGGQLHETDAAFVTDDALRSAIHNVAQWVGKKLSDETPVLDARLPNGSRVNAILSHKGTYLTIRKFQRDKLSLDKLVELGSLSPAGREFMELVVKLHKNTMVSGGTGTGKTSMLGAVSAAVPEGERVIVIEDTAELQLNQRHCLYMEAKPPDRHGRGGLTVRQLFVNSLRMRPDRIIVGEVRSGEALDLIQSMISGHAGSLSTVHANTPRDALIRLETLSLMADVEIPVYVARAQVASAIQVVIQLARFSEDGSRRVTRISEARGLDEKNNYQLVDLFVSKLKGKTDDGRLIADLVPTGHLPTFASEPFEQGMEGLIRYSAPLWKKA